LPYGKQRLVELAVALCLEPAVLLLDEPAAGIPSTETSIVLDALERLPADIAILMIEHDMYVVRRFGTRRHCAGRGYDPDDRQLRRRHGVG